MGTGRIAGSVVLVTGGHGFIGRHLVTRLVSMGAVRVVILDRSHGGSPLPETPVTNVRATLGEVGVAELAASLSGVRCVFHLAAEKHSDAHADPSAVLRTNVLGTEALLEAASIARVERVVFASSLYAYGRTAGGPMDELDVPHPDTVYGISKLAGELLGARRAEGAGPSFVGLRYFFAYGPEQTSLHGRKSLVVKTFERLGRGERPVVHGDGSQALDYVFVDDVVDATVRAMDTDAPAGPFNVGTGRAPTILELVARMQSIAGTALPIDYAPADETRSTVRVASVARARDVLGWVAGTSLDDGLKRTWDWVRSYL